MKTTEPKQTPLRTAALIAIAVGAMGSIGFVLRVWAGAVALDVPVSGWMFVTTLCLALYLAAVKRRDALRGEASNAPGAGVLRGSRARRIPAPRPGRTYIALFRLGARLRSERLTRQGFRILQAIQAGHAQIRKQHVHFIVRE